MIDKFEVGKYYRWIKEDGGETGKRWSLCNPMIQIKDGVPRRVIEWYPCGGDDHVLFLEGIDGKYKYCASDFDLVPEPPEGCRYLANGETIDGETMYYDCDKWMRRTFEPTHIKYKSWDSLPCIRRIESQPEIVEYQGEKWEKVKSGEVIKAGDLCAFSDQDLSRALKANSAIGCITDGQVWRKVKDTPKEDKKEEKKMGSESIREALYMMDGWHDVHVSSGKLVFSGEQKPSFKSESEIWAKVLGSIKS